MINQQGGPAPVNYNYYDAGNGSQHVYDQNWKYLFSQPSNTTASYAAPQRSSAPTTNQASSGGGPNGDSGYTSGYGPGGGVGFEPTPIPGNTNPPTSSGWYPNPNPSPTPNQPPTPTPVPYQNPSATASGGDPYSTGAGAGGAGAWGGYGYNWTGPGQVYGNAQPGGTQLAYSTGSYYDPQLGGWVAQAQAANGGNYGSSGGQWNAPTQYGGAGSGNWGSIPTGPKPQFL